MDIDEKSKEAITKIIIFSLYEFANPGGAAEATLSGKQSEYMEKVMAKYHGKPWGEEQPMTICNFFYAGVQMIVAQILDVIRRAKIDAT